MRPFALLVALWPATGFAFECNVSDADPDVPLAWPTRAIPYSVEAGIGVPLADIEASFAAWEDVPCSDLSFPIAGVVEPGTYGTVLAALTSDWPHARDAVATTALTYDRATGAILSARIELNRAGYVLADAEVETCTGADPHHDTRSILTHEIGHLIGLGHTTLHTGAATDPTMAPRVDPCDSSKRDLEDDDRAAICALYPAGALGSCADDAVRAGEYRAADAGGCTTTSGAATGLSLVLLWGLLWSKTCRNARSGG